MIENLDEFLHQEALSVDHDEDEDLFFERFYEFLHEEFVSIIDIGETPAFFMLDHCISDLFISSAGYWPGCYIGDSQVESHGHPGIELSIMTCCNALNLLESIYSVHFGGFNDQPFVYDTWPEEEHNFSDN